MVGDALSYSGARFLEVDFSGARLRECDLRGARILASWLVDVRLSGLVENLVVNDVDVSAYVEAELDRRHPERVMVREMRTADDYRATWAAVERLWADAVARARRLPEPALHEQVDEEWSFVQTLQHLVFATDAWASRTVLDEPMPYHRLGRPDSLYDPADAASIGIDLDADPPFTEVLAAWESRRDVMRAIVAGLTDAELERLSTRNPGPGYPEEPVAVGRALRVVMRESSEHHRYATRDLDVLEARHPGSDTVTG